MRDGRSRGWFQVRAVLLQRSPARSSWAKAREKVERSGEERENVPVQKPTNEGREYLERCIQVKRGRRNRPHEKERWNGRWIKKDGNRGKMRDGKDTHTYRNMMRDIRKLRPSRLELNVKGRRSFCIRESLIPLNWKKKKNSWRVFLEENSYRRVLWHTLSYFGLPYSHILLHLIISIRAILQLWEIEMISMSCHFY